VIAYDATYSVGESLSGVGVYSREILWGMAEQHPEERFRWCYRPHKILRSWNDRVPSNVSRGLLRYSAPPRSAQLFHALNQRVEFPAAKRVPVVTTFHDLFVLTGEYSSPEFRTRFAEQARRAAERSDRIIAVSQFTADQVRELLKPAVPVDVVYHGVDVPVESPPGETERRNVILHVGAIQKRKNIERLIVAFESAVPEDWKLVLAGSATGFEGDQVVDRVKLSKAAARIEVAGYVSGEQLRELYRTSRILAFPSLDEGFGIPVLEAMANGLPVITSDGSALREAAGDAAILVDPHRTESIVETLRTLTAVPGLRNQLRAQGWERAQTLPWTRAVRETWNVYRKVLL
jgi:glycosyltransferase involved in cell wall biosynthesis